MTSPKKSELKKLLKEIAEEEEGDKTKDEKDKSKMRYYSSEDENPEPTTKAPYMVVFVRKGEAPFRMKLVNMFDTIWSQLFQGGEVLCIEQKSNLKNVQRDPRITVLKKNMKKLPSREDTHRYRDNHLNPEPPSKPKSIIDKVKDKVTPKKPKGKAKGKKKK